MIAFVSRSFSDLGKTRSERNTREKATEKPGYRNRSRLFSLLNRTQANVVHRCFVGLRLLSYEDLCRQAIGKSDPEWPLPPQSRAEEQKHRASVEKAFCCLSPYFALSIAAKAATLRSQEGQPVAVNGIGLSRRHAEMCGHGRQIVGVMIHVMAAAGLGGAAMTAPVVGNHPETVAEEKHHLPCDNLAAPNQAPKGCRSTRPESSELLKPASAIGCHSASSSWMASWFEKLKKQRMQSRSKDRSKASIGPSEGSNRIAPRISAGCSFLQATNRRNMCRTESGSFSCWSTARLRCSGDTGSHGLTSLKPPCGEKEDQGIGVRHPSRPLKSGQNSMPKGS
jgi:hypothetical protein